MLANNFVKILLRIKSRVKLFEMGFQMTSFLILKVLFAMQYNTIQKVVCSWHGTVNRLYSVCFILTYGHSDGQIAKLFNILKPNINQDASA